MHASLPHRLALLCFACCGLVTLGRAAPPSPAPQEMVLFSFDDETIPWHDNLKLTLEQPHKYPGNPVLKAGPSGSVDGYGLMLYGTVIKEGPVFRMWYIAYPKADPQFPKDTTLPSRPIAYAESRDGIHWERPDLGLVEFKGNKHNNIISIEPRGHSYSVPNDYVSVMRDDAEPDPARRYKMVYIAFLPAEKHSTSVTAVSPDGLRWKLASTDEFTNGHYENTSLIRFQGLYYVTGQNLGRAGGYRPDGVDAGRAMTAFFSPDFRHWSKERALSFYRRPYEPKPESFGQELHMGAALWNRGNVVLGLYGRWHGDKIIDDKEKRKIMIFYGVEIDLGLVISNDAIHYREPVPDFVAVPTGGPNDWDAKGILQGQAFCNTEDQTLIWYSSWYTENASRATAIGAGGATRPQAIGLLTLRRDGFGYLSKHSVELGKFPGFARRDTGGGLLTKPITLQHASRLRLNVDGVSADAPLRVSLVDDAEQALPGFAEVPITQSGLQVEATFAQPIPAAKPFRLRVQWPEGAANPRFYAMYLQPTNG